MVYVYKEKAKTIITSDDMRAAKAELLKLKCEAADARTALSIKLDKLRNKTAALTAWVKRHEHKIKDDDDVGWGVEGEDSSEHSNHR